MVLAYLIDCKRAVLFEHLDRFQIGLLLPNGGEDEARGRAATLEEVALIDLSHIRSFYGVADEPAEEEADQ